MSILPSLIQYSFGIPSQSSKTEKKKRVLNRKGRSQIIPTCRCYDLIPKRCPSKKPSYPFRKVAGYKINTQKSVTFLYTKNE
jgi:hypothetical protein